MAKLPIDKVFICGFVSDEKKTLDILERAGVVEINDKVIESDSLKKMVTTSDILTCNKNIKLCDDAIEILSKYDNSKTSMLDSFSGPKHISLKEFDKKSSEVDASIEAAKNIQDFAKKFDENKVEIVRKEQEIETLKPWEQFDVSLSYSGTRTTLLYVGSVKGNYNYQDLYNSIITDEIANLTYINILSTDKDLTTFEVITVSEYKEIVEDNLKKIGFIRAPYSNLIPREEIKKLENEITNLKNENENLIKKIKNEANVKDNIKFARDFMALCKSREESIEKIQISDSMFFLEGYIPKKCEEYLSNKLSSNKELYIEYSEPSDDDDVPVLLHNNSFSDPMETVVESYSLPGKKEFDPSVILSVFYYLFFGMMLSDAGYGALLVIGCAFILATCKGMEKGTKEFIKLFLYSGVSAVFWGIMFGSVFGDAVDVIAHTYFGVPADVAVIKPLWFEPVKEPMRLLVFAFVLGIIHLFTGLFIKFILYIKNGNIKDAIYDVVFWFMFVAGGIVYLLTMPMITNMFGLSDVVKLSPTVAKISSIVAATGAVLIVLTGGRESKNWFKRILKGAYSAYGITSWLSDILSYSRILALGLATGVIAQVFNKMGSMVNIPVVGLIIFILVFIIGHVLNLFINALGAYVHTNRLQFVEFFGKFYEGGGRKFMPFKENTKYYYVEEEI